MIEANEKDKKDLQQKQDMFALQDQKLFKFNLPFQKVLGFCPMYDDTCVVMAIKSHRLECVGHYDKNGKLINQFLFQDSNLFPYAIISDRQIIWVDNDRNLLLQWNLEKHRNKDKDGYKEQDYFLQFPFNFKNQQCDTHQLFVFPENKLICVAEWGRHDSNMFRLTYLEYPLNKNSQPVCEYQSTDVWTYEYTVRRANTRSMLIWFKSAQKQNIQFKTFELISVDNTWKESQVNYKLVNPIKRENNQISQLSIGNIWEMIPRKFLFITITDRPHTEQKYPNSVFVYQVDNQIFRQANFAFEGKYRLQYVDYYSFGTTSMVKSFNFIQGKAQETPIYYIDNTQERIGAKRFWKCGHLNKYTFPAYDANLIVDAEYENGNVGQILSREIRLINLKELFIFFLHEILPDVDEDLSRQVSHILDNRQ